MTRPRILLVAGEPSGDRWGARLARELNTSAELEGTGSIMMADAGVSLFARSDEFNALGPLQSLGKLGTHVRLMRNIVDRCATGRYQAAVLIDYPGFNLRLAARLKRLGMPVMLYVAPQLWAWGNPKTSRVLKAVDRIAAILPFEVAFFRTLQVEVDYVGHPALDEDDYGRQFDREDGLVGLAPGARSGERKRMLPTMIATADVLSDMNRNFRFEIATRARLGNCPIPEQNPDTLLETAVGMLTKSGTYSLEVALAGVPTCVMYKLDALTYQIMKRRVNIDHIAMANILLQRKAVPEFVQNQATPQAMAEALQDRIERREEADGLAAELQRTLGGPGASARVAEMSMELANR